MILANLYFGIDTSLSAGVAMQAAAWLLEVGYRHMPVMDEGELLGIVSLRDILASMLFSR